MKNEINFYYFKWDCLENKTIKEIHLIWDYEISGTLSDAITNLPLTLQKLTLSFDFDDSLDALKDLPNLTHLVFPHNSWFNQSIDFLPKSLTHLILGHSFNRRIDHLPGITAPGCSPMSNLPNLISLKLCGQFNQPLNHLPPSLKILELNGEFNQPLDQLPFALEVLILNNKFDQSINLAPKSLIKLTLGHKFNQSIEVLKDFLNLTHLSLGKDFNQELTALPMSLSHLSFGFSFRNEIDALAQCPNLVSLSFGFYFNKSITILSKCSKLSTLSLGHYFNKKIKFLPKSILTLRLDTKFGKSLKRLPKGIINLELKTDCSTVNLPNGIIHLTLGPDFKGTLGSKSTPETAHQWNAYFESGGGPLTILPPSLKYLTLKGSYDKSLALTDPSILILRTP